MQSIPGKHLAYYLSWSAAIAALLLGTVVLFGWYTHDASLIQVNPAFVPMQYNTALGFALAGLGLLAMLISRSRIAMLFGMLVLLTGALTLIEYIFGMDLHIDQLFMQHYINVATSHPGRMAPNTALCFSLSGLALLLAQMNFATHRSLWVGTLGAIIIALGSVALSGYLSGLETAYGWGNLTRMAIHTSAGFIVLGCGLAAYSWHAKKIDHDALPYWLPISAGIGSATITISVWQALHSMEINMITALGPEAERFADEGVLIFGLLLTIALVLAIWFAQKAQQRLKASIRMQQKLNEYREVLEQRVDERTASLKAVNEEIKDFAYIVSHDLRSPIVNLKGFTRELELTLKEISEKIVASGKNDDEQCKDIVRMIEQDIPDSMSFILTSVDKMDAMLSSILQLSRLGRRELQIEDVNLDALCRTIADTLAFQMQQAGCRISISPLPVIRNDRVVMQQIMDNLIGNAVKYLSPERAGEILIDSEIKNGNIVIRVKDNGMGITPEEHDKVFQIFRRGRHADIVGDGMGLAYVQTLVRAQNGSIDFESAADQGSTFTVSLPLRAEQNDTSLMEAM